MYEFLSYLLNYKLFLKFVIHFEQIFIFLTLVLNLLLKPFETYNSDFQ